MVTGDELSLAAGGRRARVTLNVRNSRFVAPFQHRDDRPDRHRSRVQRGRRRSAPRRRARVARPGLRRRRGRRRLDRRHRRARPRAPAPTSLRHPFNLGIGGAVQSGYQYALEHGYDVAVQVDGDGQHDPRCLAELLHAPARAPGARHGHRLALPRRPTATATAPPPRAGIGIRIFSGVLSRIVGQRVTDPTSGLRMADRRGIELFARDYPHDYPEVEAVLLMPRAPARERRAAGEDARAHRRRLVDQLDALGLLHDQGAAGGVRRPVARAPGGRAGRRRRRSPAEHGDLDGRLAPPDPRDHRHRRAVRARVRARAPAAAAGALRAAVAVLVRRAARRWRSGAGAARGARRRRSGSSTRRRRCSRSRFGFVLVLLLHFSLVISRLAEQNKVLAQRSACSSTRSTSCARSRRGDRASARRRGEQPAELTRYALTALAVVIVAHDSAAHLPEHARCAAAAAAARATSC